jgi:hypothetical protein
MAARRDFPVGEVELARAIRCSRCGRVVVWKTPFGYSRVVPLDLGSIERGPTGEARLEIHFPFCVDRRPKRRRRHVRKAQPEDEWIR